MKTDKSTSQRRQNASRANGSRSRGPVTPDGKARASRNAVQHGVLATLLTLDPQEAAIFNRIHAEYVARFEPRDQVEHDLVEEVVRAKWQMRQAWAYESAIVGLQVAQDTEKVDREWKSLGDHDRRALAYAAALKDSSTLPNLQRYARSLALQSEKGIRMLLELRKQRLPPAFEPDPETSKSPQRNEPSPAFEHPESLPESPQNDTQPAAREVQAYATIPAVARIRWPYSPHQTPIAAMELTNAATG